MRIVEGNRDQDSEPLSTIVVCVNERLGATAISCGGSDSVTIADALEAGVQARELDVVIDRVHCLGLCTRGPNVRFIPGGDWFTEVKPADADRILDRFEEATE